jgi:tRNA(Leu) C34 or U34 (ribose-2'-O)-methylase TrmL
MLPELTRLAGDHARRVKAVLIASSTEIVCALGLTEEDLALFGPETEGLH